MLDVLEIRLEHSLDVDHLLDHLLLFDDFELFLELIAHVARVLASQDLLVHLLGLLLQLRSSLRQVAEVALLR